MRAEDNRNQKTMKELSPADKKLAEKIFEDIDKILKGIDDKLDIFAAQLKLKL